jgi:UDP-3-O-acyl-N-acetylglucosamine deacetylase
MILTQQPLYAANTPDPFGVSNCDATRRDMTIRFCLSHMSVLRYCANFFEAKSSMNATQTEPGRILGGDASAIRKAYESFNRMPVDQEMLEAETPNTGRTTIARPCAVSGPGTFFGRAQRTLKFLPTTFSGWWIDRTDLADSLPVRVAIDNVWTTGRVVSNIVLRAGSPRNYLRMVEHIVALKVGLGIDDLMIQVDSGDPPLLDNSSLDIVKALESAGIEKDDNMPGWLTVKQAVTLGGVRDSFLTFHPADSGSRALTIDCAIDFPNAIGKQRIRFAVSPRACTHGSFARTNTSWGIMLYCMTIGKMFAEIRNLGYTTKNLQIAGRSKFVNEARLCHEGKSLEAVWHRASLDLLAAIALIADGRLAGHVVSYKAGHTLDCRMITKLHRDSLLVPLT